jgi:hypothetical protein
VIRYRCERVPGLQPLGGPVHVPCPQCRRLTLDEHAEVVAGLFREVWDRHMTEDDLDMSLTTAVIRELLERKVIE